MDHDKRRHERARRINELNRNPLERPDEWASEEAGREALERALGEWSQEIIEPDHKVTEGPILERYVWEGGGWTWQEDYQNRKLAWCGFFASFAWLSVNAKIRKKCFPSTYRLRQWAKGTAREIKRLEDARPGDILVIATSNGKRWGDHITLIERIDQEGAWTIEGNAFGETPKAQRAEGVVRCYRPKDKIRFIYRPLEVDLD
jgi:hypothetical protein